MTIINNKTLLRVGLDPVVINQSVIPVMEAMPIDITGENLRPGALANVWVDDVSVNPFIQGCSTLTTNVGFQGNVLNFLEGIYCNTTHGYAYVHDTANSLNGWVLYIDENFTSLNLTPFGPANSNSFSATNYVIGEMVYQSPNTATANIYANTYVGRVVYWAPQDGSLHLQTIFGTIANTANANTLYKSGSTQLANVVSPVVGNKFPNSTSVTSVKNVNAIFSTTAYNHTHGQVSVVAAAPNQIQFTSQVNANAVNSLVTLVAGTGYGQNAKIISINGTGLATLNTNLSSHSGNTFYSVGGFYVNQIGRAPGILWFPEDGYFSFQTGNRLITINDATSAQSTSATMRAVGTFAATGQLSPNGKVPVVGSPPTMSPQANSVVAPSTTTSSQQDNNQPINNAVASNDPLVQTFFTPKPTVNKIDNGIFLTSCDLYFQAKPTGNNTQFPVSVYIVDTVNGFPTTNILGRATVRWEGVQITDGINTFPGAGNLASNTHFIFDTPVYLAPGTEYGLVVYSESPNYFIWVADIGEPIINSTRLVSPSPYIGSFFKSQNATAWSPIQNRSLMFNLNKAVFSLATAVLNFNLAAPFGQTILMDQVLLHSQDVTFGPANVQYAIKTVNANTNAYDANYFTIFNNTPFSFGGDLTTSSLSSTRRRMIPAGNVNGMLVQVQLSTTDTDVSPMFHSERLSFTSLANFINPAGITNFDITITNPGNHINAANIVVTIGAPLGDNPIQATANVLANGLSGNSVVAINMINNGAGYTTSPTITITEAGAPSNATAVINGEDQILGGTGYTRYVTRAITLADGFDSGDIQVFMSAVRPQGTDISVYYKVLGSTDDDVITNKKWNLMNKQFDVFSPDQATPIDITFNTGLNSLGVANGTVAYVQNGVQYPIGGKFKQFAIKIVLSANDPTVPPIVNNIRAVAVPAG